ncbi:extracellular metalloproteinase MEP [Rhizoctonia solani AG-3 Rhs1AP]|uniref:Extracellular metalloproteinase n=1 Tax=Rhizoctonia solani AG-3 Rhs1AP TaxID=1086054 RepID=X8JGD9_9AGAM|nr:extracellular metalloproteinase MEP [Rhizoctonia solani AG-3 Rhs1AP]
MVPLAKLLGIAPLIASGVIAAPWNTGQSSTTHHIRALGPNRVKVKSYHPETTFKTYGVTGMDHPLSKRGINASSSDAAKQFLVSETGTHPDEVVHRTGHTSDGISNEYFHQQLNGIRVANAVANVAIRDGKVISYGANFVKPRSVRPAIAQISAEDAIRRAESVTGAKYNSYPLVQEYFIKDTGDAVLVYSVEVENEETHEWYSVHVDATNCEVVNIVDFVHHLTSYRVTPFTSQDPTGAGFIVATDPYDKSASPNGWHQYGTTTTTSTSGNNVLSYTGTTSGTTSQSSPINIYDYIRNPDLSPSEGPNPDAARVNVFYIANMVHDLTYRYGFTEKTWNYQQDNRGLGGLGNDRVEIEVQSHLPGLITVPADGRSAKIYLGAWSQGDGAFQNDVTVHELMHGIVGRLTGGGTAKCFTTAEAHELNEGWADAFPDLIQRTTAVDRDFSIAIWANGKNLRTYPYSTNISVNPRMYGDASTASDALAIAELWAVIWHDIIMLLIKERGFASNLLDPTLTSGNTIALHLMIDGLIIQPCNPTFITARDAIIQADANRYNGANKCTLWKGFAKRGLGYGATTIKANSDTLPPGC